MTKNTTSCTRAEITLLHPAKTERVMNKLEEIEVFLQDDENPLLLNDTKFPFGARTRDLFGHFSLYLNIQMNNV